MKNDLQLRPHQIPPDGDWSVWTMTSGRAGGKSFAAAHWLVSNATQFGETDWVVVCADTQKAQWCSLLVGQMLASYGHDPTLSDAEWPDFFSLHNGAEIVFYTTAECAKLANSVWHGAWLEDVDEWESITPWNVLRGALSLDAQVVATIRNFTPPMVMELHGSAIEPRFVSRTLAAWPNSQGRQNRV